MSNEDRILKWREERSDAASAGRAERLRAAAADTEDRLARARDASVARIEAERQARRDGQAADSLRAREIGESLLPDPASLAAGQQSMVEIQRRRLYTRGWRLLGLLGLPTLLVVLYTLLWATPLYETEALFTIRTIEGNAASASGGLLNIGGAASTTADAFQVREFILSREMMNRMQSRLAFLDSFRGSAMDPLSRVRTTPLLGIDDHDYYRRRVRVAVDVQEGVLKLHVQARTAADAVRYAEGLIGFARDQVNRQSRAMNADQIAALERTVAGAEAEVRRSAMVRSNVQQRRGELDPRQAAATIYQVIGSLEVQLAEAENSRTALRASGLTESPALPQLEARLGALRQQIVEQRARLVGGGGGSLQRTAYAFETAGEQKQLAEIKLQSALNTLAQARLRALEQVRYFVVIARPMPPVIPLVYRGPALGFMSLIGLVLSFGLVSTMVEIRRLKTR